MDNRFELCETLNCSNKPLVEWKLVDTAVKYKCIEKEEVIRLLNDMDNEIKYLRKEVSKQKLEKWGITNFFKNLPDSNYTDYFF